MMSEEDFLDGVERAVELARGVLGGTVQSAASPWQEKQDARSLVRMNLLLKEIQMRRLAGGVS